MAISGLDLLIQSRDILDPLTKMHFILKGNLNGNPTKSLCDTVSDC
jgi:hypothetical protein